MTENEKRYWLDGDDGLKPYLRMKDKGMPKGKVEQMAWLLLNGGLCGFCKVCRDEPCNIKDGEKCTDNIAKYIKETVLNEVESELQQYRAIGTVKECREAREKQIKKKPSIWGDGYDSKGKMIYDMYDCPNCGKSYEIDYSDYEYCPNCGQAFNRSDFPK